jgi:hypothetical protein
MITLVIAQTQDEALKRTGAINPSLHSLHYQATRVYIKSIRILLTSLSSTVPRSKACFPCNGPTSGTALRRRMLILALILAMVSREKYSFLKIKWIHAFLLFKPFYSVERASWIVTTNVIKSFGEIAKRWKTFVCRIKSKTSRTLI